MSLRALHLGTFGQLAESLGLDEAVLAVMPDGRPPPWAGPVFYAVHQLSWSSQSDLSLDESFGLGVTITLRTDGTPFDKAGLKLLVEPQGLYWRAEECRAALHMNEGVRLKALEVIREDAAGEGDEANGFNLPLVFQGAGSPEPKVANWWHARGKAGKGPAGWAIALRFATSRLQKIEEAR